jgi:hypothetical protein
LRAFDLRAGSARQVTICTRASGEEPERATYAARAIAYALGAPAPPTPGVSTFRLHSGATCTVVSLFDATSGISWRPGSAPAGDFVVGVQAIAGLAYLVLGYLGHHALLEAARLVRPRSRGKVATPDVDTGPATHLLDRGRLERFPALMRAELLSEAPVQGLGACRGCGCLILPWTAHNCLAPACQRAEP